MVAFTIRFSCNGSSLNSTQRFQSSIIESERPAELYSALFQSMPDVEGKVLARVRQELEQGEFHPLGQEDTSGLLRSLVVQLSPRGEFDPASAPKAQNSDPVMGRSPVIFLLRNRISVLW